LTLTKEESIALRMTIKKIRKLLYKSEIADEFRILLGLIIARTVASEINNRKVVTAVESAQSLLGHNVTVEFLSALRDVYEDHTGKKYENKEVDKLIEDIQN